MKKRHPNAVTDPNLIAELNSSVGFQSESAPAQNKVTDPNLIAELNQQAGIKDSGFNPSFKEKIAPNILAGLAQLGHSVINAPHNLVNMISPEMASHIPTQPNYNYSEMLKIPGTTADKFMQGIAANAPAAVMPAMRLGSLGAGMESIPGIGKFLAAATGRAIPQAGFGAATNENPLQGAKEMGGLSLATEPLPLALKGIGKMVAPLQPAKYAKEFMEKLSGGHSLEDNAKILAQYIKTGYEKAKDEGSKLYGPIFSHNNLGSDSIYRPLKEVPPKRYKYTDKPIRKWEGSPISLNATGDLKELINKFNRKPSLENAHTLQSQLGSEMSAIRPTSIADKQELKRYGKVRDQIKGQINTFLERKDPELAAKYKAASDYHRENIAPYTENNKIKEIAKGKIKNPDNLLDIFKNPEPRTSKVIEDLGHDAKHRILYAHLGKENTKLSPDRLMSEISKLDEKGLSSYLTPDLIKHFETLNSRLNYRNRAQNIAGGLLGYKASQMMGMPPGMEALTAIGSGFASPAAAKTLQGLMPNEKIQQVISDLLSKSYYPAGREGLGYGLGYGVNSQGRDQHGSRS